jgi:hypothetical protein
MAYVIFIMQFLNVADNLADKFGSDLSARRSIQAPPPIIVACVFV